MDLILVQLFNGISLGMIYVLMAVGLTVIFGMLNIINFSHGAQYMMGAFAAYLMLKYSGLGYWPALIIAPLVVGITGVIVERLFLQWLYKLDHLYGLLLTFGLALIIEGVARNQLGSAGLPYVVPDELRGRVISTYFWAQQGVAPFGSLFIGFLAQQAGAPLAVRIGGIVCLVGYVAVAFLNPTIRRVVTE